MGEPGSIRKFFSAPAFPDEEKSHTALILNYIVWSLIAVLAVASAVGLPFLFVDTYRSAAFIAGFLAILLIARWLMRSGRVALAARILTLVIWCLFAAIATLSGGIFSVNLIFFLSVAVQAGLTCGTSWAVGIAAASITYTLALALLQNAGVGLPSPFPSPPLSRWLELSLGLSVTLVSLILSLRSRISAFARAKNELRVRLEAEAALKESEERFRAIFDSVSEAVFLHRIDGPILDVNRKVIDFFGWTREEILAGVGVREMSAGTGEFTAANASAYLERAVAGENLVFEWRARRKDGSLFWVENHMNRAVIAGVPRILVTSRDVDDRMREREEREKLEEGLRQAQKMESVGRLAGGVAHDFNNLLTGILGNLELALMEEPSQAVKDRISEAMRAGGRAAELTKQLLAVSRKQIIEPVAIDLRDLVESLRDMLSRILGERIELVTDCPADPCAIFADPAQMEHMILNLAVNARDAMPTGGRLTISLKNADAPAASDGTDSGWVVLSIADTGTGMAPEVLAHAFEPFFTTKARGKGTGLGLSIVFGIVSQNGGSIDVDTEPGKGSSFSVRFPRRPEPAVVPTETPGDAPIKRGQESVLLVEDDDLVRDISIRALSSSGYAVRACASAEEAMELLPSLGKIDILVTDVVLPGMNGRLMAKRIEAVRPGLRVLFVSGYPNDVISDNGIIRRGIHFLAKPFNPAELSAKVRSLLDSAESGVM